VWRYLEDLAIGDCENQHRQQECRPHGWTHGHRSTNAITARSASLLDDRANSACYVS
jgi:hypothetical protein